MVFEPQRPLSGAVVGSSAFQDATGDTWQEMYNHPCTFGPDVFKAKMTYIIQKPNLNTSWLFRADILYDDQVQVQIGQADSHSQPRVREMNLGRQRIIVRKLIPGNPKRDAPLVQTCTFHQSQNDDGSTSTLVLYIPHVDAPEEVPFYHPQVGGIAHLHRWDPSTHTGTLSVHFLPFPDGGGVALTDKKVQRTAYHLLQLIHKLGTDADYVKRVHHDLVVPQARFQDRFIHLKSKYAKSLIDSWAEVTDPAKHVFEDLSIAAFLIELWVDMYPTGAFPGFVDIGCGNGLLVHLLNQEGYAGWGFDARRRSSWANYETWQPCSPTGRSLEQRLLLPYVLKDTDPGADPDRSSDHNPDTKTTSTGTKTGIHDGRFPPGTFIVSNHADELTPWTPILAAASGCPFIMIPCCSHDLSGARYRPPPPKDRSKGHSTYASLVAWVAQIAEDCGFTVETEMLRIPSTRNVGLLGRTRASTETAVDLGAIISKYGGAVGFEATVMKLLKADPRGH